MLRYAVLLLFAWFCDAAQAQVFRAYLSFTGSDANPCTLTAPCRLLPRALEVVATGGEVWILDSANYNVGTVTVTRSVSILAVPGAIGSLVTTTGPAIASHTENVTLALRNLVFVPLPGDNGLQHGVSATKGALVVEQCEFSGLTHAALHVLGPVDVKVSNVTVVGSPIGFYFRQGVSAAVTNVRFDRIGSYAIFATVDQGPGVTTVMVDDSVAYLGLRGFTAYAKGTGAVVRLAIARTIVAGNEWGVEANGSDGGSAMVSISDSMITGNTTYGLVQSGSGVMRPLGNNHLADNGNDTLGTMTTTQTR